MAPHVRLAVTVTPSASTITGPELLSPNNGMYFLNFLEMHAVTQYWLSLWLQSVKQSSWNPQLVLISFLGERPMLSDHWLSVTLVYCGQTVGWIKMPLGTLVGLSLGDIGLDGDPAPPPKRGGTAALTLQLMSVVAKRLDGSRCHLVQR